MKKHISFLWVLFLVVSLVSGCSSATPSPASTPTPVPPTPLPFTPTTSPTPTQTPIPKILLPVRGLYVQFDRRGYPSQYWSGQVIREFNTFDDVVGRTVAEEIALQLDQMKQMGVNTITFELRSSDPVYIPGPFLPPTCNIGPDLGLQYPQPAAAEINNLIEFLDLLQTKGLQVYLRLVNTHMEEQPPVNNELWLGTILKAIKDHPALDLVLFEGNGRVIDTNGDGVVDSCGIPAEPPLWETSTGTGAKYVAWAINYAHSLGLPYRKLSAEAIVGDYFTYSLPPSGPGPQDPHPFDPPHILKGIFDSLDIPDDQRTYAISFYEHRKCSTARGLPCVDEDPHAWAIETVLNLFDTIGRQNGARVVAPEMGLLNPVEETWTTEMALKSLVWIMQAYGIDGGCFWRWTDFYNSEELDPTLQSPVKQRGPGFIYNPVKDILAQLYTQGSANDLKLTPDDIPPVFSSVSVSPSVIRNGEPFEISAGLGETHLFVTADVSALDPAQTGLVPLIQLRDGLYQAAVTLNSWNLLPNGTGTVRIAAMDFWSNTGSTSVTVELNNPPPLLDTIPPNDDFQGKSLDDRKWSSYADAGASVRQEERLVLSTGTQQPTAAAQVSSTWAFPGDFDVQVDFQIGEGWASPAQEHLDGAFLAVNIDSQNYRITRLRSTNEDKLFSWSSTGVLTQEYITGVTSGKYRLVRNGTDLYLLYDIGKGWQELAKTSVPAAPAQVNLGNASVNASTAFTTYFDNFRINSGLTTFTP